jgi:DsbC/DsbD-like thiol-disulfide interchange protein/cytochrome c biogenesis protein CcdA/thiol-disulfide isomerase/thioredoxin
VIRFLAPSVRALALLLPLAVPCGFAQAGAVVETPQVRAELLAHAPEGIAAGKPLWLGLQIRHEPHWHTYWRNPGDSGLPTRFEWQLPAGVTAGEIDWPTPKRLPIGPLLNYGYEGTVLLPVQIKISDTYRERLPLMVKLRADWLVCKIECIPESGEFDLSLPPFIPRQAHEAAFLHALKNRPTEITTIRAEARVEGDKLIMRVANLPPELQNQNAQVFPETAGVIDHAAPLAQRWEGGLWEGRMPISPQRSASPQSIPAVLVFDAQNLRVEAPMNAPWPAPGAAPATFDATRPPPPPPAPVPAADMSFALALLLAFLGGMLLNLMPCVFPVLSLKLLGFAHHASERRYLVLGGVTYTLGVLLSFVGLAALLIALRSAGEQLGWGFQLQEPAFVAALAVLFTLIGLNLAGVFEVGTLLPTSAAGWQSKHPAVDSFLTGVLAVLIASPCTAPFMGAALGFAIGLPALSALAIFAALGLGMAAPYLLASLVPAVARALPRPGAWLLRFKILMAFPMFATVVWLIWVLGQQTGIDAAAAMLALLVVLALAVWAWASPIVSGRARLWIGLPALALLALGLIWTLPLLKETPMTHAESTGKWERWSPQRVADYRAQGRPVFVDFTAAWCVTCQYNKRTALSDASVLEAFELNRVALLRADWTSRDAEITAALAQLGRSGVPVYAVYAPGSEAPPRLLSELLSVDEVRAAVSAW